MFQSTTFFKPSLSLRIEPAKLPVDLRRAVPFERQLGILPTCKVAVFQSTSCHTVCDKGNIFQFLLFDKNFAGFWIYVMAVTDQLCIGMWQLGTWSPTIPSSR